MEPSEELIRGALERILGSADFCRSGRSQQFLAHVVDCALRGDERSLKETTLGSVLFGRQPGYDAASDPSVRVRASDVRKRLLAYYQTAGARDPVRIELAPGSYVPRFVMAEEGPAENRNEAGDLTGLLLGLAQAIGGEGAHVGVLRGEEVVTVAAVAGGNVADGFEYPVAGSPAEKIAAGHGSVVAEEWNGKWYASAPLFDSRGKLLGLVAVVLVRPPLDRQLANALLGLYGARIAGDLERRTASIPVEAAVLERALAGEVESFDWQVTRPGGPTLHLRVTLERVDPPT